MMLELSLSRIQTPTDGRKFLVGMTLRSLFFLPECLEAERNFLWAELWSFYHNLPANAFTKMD